MSRLFGTDGIRGVANEAPLTTELAQRLGRELVATLLEHHGASKVRLVVGRDTRLSGPLLEAALVSGALSAGADVYAVGVVPTPGIAHLTRRLEAHGGVVLSASHNPFEDNGIKIFSAEGAKLPDAWEDEIERRLAGPGGAPTPTGAQIGRLVSYAPAEAEYIAHARHGFSFDLDGLTIALDCAHGATYRVAPKVFRGLGAKVIVLGARPDGRNINRRSGALHPEALQKKVVASGAHVGLAFDGDGDRLIAVDERGLVRDGDYVLAILGRRLAGQGRLRMGVVVTTVMANLGLDRALTSAGVRVVKTQVGDRYVLEEMLKLDARPLEHRRRDRVRAPPPRRDEGDRAIALRPGVVHDQVPPGPRQRAGQGEASLRYDSRAGRPGDRSRGRDERGRAHRAPLLRHGVSRADHGRGRRAGARRAYRRRAGGDDSLGDRPVMGSGSDF